MKKYLLMFAYALELMWQLFQNGFPILLVILVAMYKVFGTSMVTNFSICFIGVCLVLFIEDKINKHTYKSHLM